MRLNFHFLKIAQGVVQQKTIARHMTGNRCFIKIP